MHLHRVVLTILYIATLIVAVYLSLVGWEYYALANSERPHHELHELWKPSGFIGHGVGIIGSALVLIMLLYSVRKRSQMMQNWGNIRYWLNYHIWMGIAGPILILFHTTFKFGGIVSVSFWSMVAVVLSGVLGRYIYIQIPRSLSGHELSVGDLRELEEDLQERITREASGNERVLNILRTFIQYENQDAGEKEVLISWLSEDASSLFRYRSLRRRLLQESGISGREVRTLIALAKKREKLHRRMAFLNTARRLLHHWHIFHKPFAIIMILIMIVHVIITVSFGYRWIF
jgi:hypothetical protein